MPHKINAPRGSLVSLQLRSPPMWVFARRIKRPNVAAVQRPHDTNSRKHRRSAQRRHQDQAFDRGLPFCGVGFFLRQRHDVGRGVLKGSERLAFRQRYRILKRSFPAAISYRRPVAAVADRGIRSPRSNLRYFPAASPTRRATYRNRPRCGLTKTLAMPAQNRRGSGRR
jgi:hypothetical protein